MGAAPLPALLAAQLNPSDSDVIFRPPCTAECNFCQRFLNSLSWVGPLLRAILPSKCILGAAHVKKSSFLLPSWLRNRRQIFFLLPLSDQCSFPIFGVDLSSPYTDYRVLSVSILRPAI